jgi:hypothetical protein
MSKGTLSEVFHTDPEIMGGTPVFTGTRVLDSNAGAVGGKPKLRPFYRANLAVTWAGWTGKCF